MESDKPSFTTPPCEFTFAGSNFDVRSISFIDPSTYVAPGAGAGHGVPGKAKQRRTRRRVEPLAAQRGPEIFHRNVTERKLFQAVSAGDVNQVERMLASDEMSGMDVSLQDKAGRTLLHVAAAAGNNAMVRMLLDNGANPSIQDSIGNTPLHLAACTSKVATVTLLLGAGTDVSLVDMRGCTPVRLAQTKLKYLRNNSANMSLTDHSQAVEQVAYMIREYARCVGDQDGVEEVFDIAAQLSNSTNQDEVSAVADLLETFTTLKLKGDDN